jgi:hypothetical protein
VITISPREVAAQRRPAEAQPEGGRFDVVVVQTSPADVLPEGRGVLSGRPVYSVYLRVGSAKEWILQYCLPKPGEEGPGRQEMVVVQGSPTPIGAPYPLKTARPEVAVENTRYILIHGYVDESGVFKDLRPVGVRSKQHAAEILAALKRWQFRPATKDGQPVLVEILLAIPPYST